MNPRVHDFFVSRSVKRLKQSPDGESDTGAVALDSLRSIPAWVLLGEPGAGKTSAFVKEVEAGNGLYLTIAEFVEDDIEDEWKNRCLFLDGLDEVRAGGTNESSILRRVRAKLRKLGRPPFRIACRAADWYGQSDHTDIIGASPDGQLGIYALEPLNQADIRNILKSSFPEADADEFIAQARQHGVEALLSNPQTLQMIVTAQREGVWPDNRGDLYRRACETLVQEENRRHRDSKRHQPVAKEKLLDAAGQLFAALLISDKSGIALDSSARHERFPELEAFQPDSLDLAAAVLHTRLFVPSSSNDERLEPPHRSVAEYLAARWLGSRIDERSLSLKRVRNLMLGFDGKAVAGLRGLYGWLALTSLTARQWLIQNDPVTVALYSDPRSMALEDKRRLLREIYLQTQDDPSVLWGIENPAAPFQAELRDDYLAALRDPKRDDSTQTYVGFILKVIRHSASEVDLTAALRSTAADASRWESVRCYAMEAWLASGVSSGEAIEFLDQLDRGEISDPDETLAGILLSALFPRDLTASDVLRYLHSPRSKMLGGKYRHFWQYEFPKTVSEDDLPCVLDQLAQRHDLQSMDLAESGISRMLAMLAARGVQIHGDNISDERFFTWLRIGADESDERYTPEFHQAIIQWLRDRPQRYKGLLGLCFDRNENTLRPLYWWLLRRIPAPADIGLWHLQQIDGASRNEALAKWHLGEAARALFWSNQQGLTIDMLMDWAGNDSVRKSWLEPHLVCDISHRLKDRNPSIQERQRAQAESRKERSARLRTKIPEIRSGTAHPALMDELAGVWLNRYANIRGETPRDRFKDYCDNDEEVFAVARSGMSACIERKDLPTVKEIIDADLRRQVYKIGNACLLGMKLVWEENPTAVDSLDSSIVEKMVCFRLTNSAEVPDWFLHLAGSKPELVAKILVAYATARFRAGEDRVAGIDVLARDAAYAAVARLAVPPLLRCFPTRSKAAQLDRLNSLLRAALRYESPELADIVAARLKRKSLDPGQRVYFLFTGTLINPGRYEQQLWDFVGQSWQRIRHISDFLGKRFSDLPMDLTLSAQTFGKLIEIQTPFAVVDLPRGTIVITPGVKLGDHVRSLIGKLTALGTTDSLEEINRLLAIPALQKIKDLLLSSRREVIQRLRENSFSHPSLSDVARILANQSPTGPADLQAIVLDQLEQIASEIQTNNSDLFRQFWTEGAENRHKSENSCRDALLAMLRRRLEPLDIDSQPEVDYVHDKRADIHVSYQNKFAVPIEIKGEWHPGLWTSVQNQLIPQYTRPRETDGFGIYVVLWFGGAEQPPPRDGGKRPATSSDLESRLYNYLPEEDRKRIAVKVIDVSWLGNLSRN